MAIKVPPAKNYQSPLVSRPTRWDAPPVEGDRLVAVEIDWATMGGENNCVNINLQDNATLNFTQVVALSIDNSLCASDVVFVFPDTAETVAIPAYAPKCIVPVFTNQTQFYVYAPKAEGSDVTRFSIHNSMPPPTSIPLTVQQQTQFVANLAADGATTHTILPANFSGTLRGLTVFLGSPVTNSGALTIQLKDGNNEVLAGSQFFSDSTDSSNNLFLIQLNPVYLRFMSGIKLFQNGVNVGGFYSVNLLYQTP